MADNRTVPPDVLDAAMCSAGAQALLHRLGPAEARNLRTDLSDVLAAALLAWVTIPAPRTIRETA